MTPKTGCSLHFPSEFLKSCMYQIVVPLHMYIGYTYVDVLRLKLERQGCGFVQSLMPLSCL
jgi:hypothetical protein